jgi:hypothetical protein
MHPLPRNTFSRSRIMWLLCMVLLLPLGQSAATWHMLSHVHFGQVEGDGDHALHEDHCDLDGSATALIGGAPLTVVFDLPRSTAHQEAPVLAWHDVLWSAPTPAYNSQAPPFSLL